MIDLARVGNNILALGIIFGIGYIIYKKTLGENQNIMDRLSFKRK